MKFEVLVNTIQETHVALQQSAVKAINRYLTIRNWMIGYHIVEFEQLGEDRATYGSRLLDNIAKRLKPTGIKGITAAELSRYRQFYSTYTYIFGTVSQELRRIELPENILGTLSQELLTDVKVASNEISVPPEKLLSNLSFSHFAELLKVTDPVKRTYYEILTIKNSLSVRELKRQINTLSFERTGLSSDVTTAVKAIGKGLVPAKPAEAVKDIYLFEFLNISGNRIIQEGELETALLDHLQEFILEMGQGFCLEGRQKKILIGDEYFFVDIVFYHRILKCHVLLELKVEEFNHVNAGQLNTYLNYYKAEVMQPDDNPPVGILLVTNKNDALVQYATAGMDNALFVSKYLVELPKKQELENFLKAELKKL
jgi:predicted nuclease of restriction endonuclease-like (RecB) superfamily